MIEASRGRIVMLVDNDVDRDSRVQKQARSSAERGWEVILLGHMRQGPRKEWMLGDAKVRLLKVKQPLSTRRHLLRRAPLRAPLAYNRPDVARLRKQLVRAQKRDLHMQRLLFQLKNAGRGSALSTQLVEAKFFCQRAVLEVYGRWVGLRADKTLALEHRRRAMDSPLDRFVTAFWRKTMGGRSWRRLDPNLWDWELAYGPEIDKLKPDIIHANDFKMLGVGARAAVRARAAGRDTKLVWDAHEFLPGVKPWNPHPRWHIAQCLHEREFAPFADVVVTVSEGLGDLLINEHSLPVRPTVVANAPLQLITGRLQPPAGIREACGLGPEQRILVYSGLAAPQRGLDMIVEAMPFLTDIHVALVVPKLNADYVLSLIRRARENGVEDRLHVLPYVPVDEIVSFLSSADIGVIPILHYPNHEIALITKFFEYSHARLPIVVSDVKTMSEKVRETGQGEVFVAEDLEDFVRAVKAVLADPKRYRDAYDKPGLLDEWTWESQADILDEVYGKLKPRPSN